MESKTFSKPFIVVLEENWYKKGDILTSASNFQVRVTKVYKYNLWRKILNFFGIKFKLFNCVLVKPIS